MVAHICGVVQMGCGNPVGCVAHRDSALGCGATVPGSNLGSPQPLGCHWAEDGPVCVDLALRGGGRTISQGHYVHQNIVQYRQRKPVGLLPGLAQAISRPFWRIG